MNRDDFIHMAREAGFNIEQGFLLRVTGIDEDLVRFAELVAAAERERCESICYDMIERSGYSGVEHRGFENGCIACAEAVADEMHQLLRRHEGS